MSAIRGYECDRCKTVVAVGWRTLRHYYGWVMVAQSPHALFTAATRHFCHDCAPIITATTTTTRTKR
jgi:hypothetical protein